MDTIIKEFYNIPTTCISDAMEGLNNLNQMIKPVRDDIKTVGRAFTVKLRATDNLMVLKAIREAKPGNVIVVDGKGYDYNAVCGDFVVSLAQTLGIEGIVIDGAVRDISGIRKLKYPVFCKAVTIAAGGKSGYGEINIPISCGNAVINPGDIIVGDENGVVCVPQKIERDVLEKAKEKLEKDKEREESIVGNPDAVREYIDKMLSN